MSLATDEELAPSEIGSHVMRPITPPPKKEAFEDFKKQRGSEINKVFLENKGIILSHREFDPFNLEVIIHSNFTSEKEGSC